VLDERTGGCCKRSVVEGQSVREEIWHMGYRRKDRFRIASAPTLRVDPNIRIPMERRETSRRTDP
jgi:hypothetical protein